jgi:hypothetical protein
LSSGHSPGNKINPISALFAPSRLIYMPFLMSIWLNYYVIHTGDKCRFTRIYITILAKRCIDLACLNFYNVLCGGKT